LRELDDVQRRLADDLRPAMLVHLEGAWGSGADAVFVGGRGRWLKRSSGEI
jgi:hypothetical protein